MSSANSERKRYCKCVSLSVYKKEKLSFQMCVKVEQMMLLEKAVSVTLPLNRDMQGNEQFLTIVATVNYHTNTSNLRLQYLQAFRAASGFVVLY